MFKTAIFRKEIYFFQGNFPERITKAILGFGSDEFLIGTSEAVNQIVVVNEWNKDSMDDIMKDWSVKYALYIRATGLMSFEIGCRGHETIKCSPSYTIPISDEDRAILDTGEIIVPSTTKFLIPIREYRVKTRKSLQYKVLKDLFWGEENYPLDEMIDLMKRRWVDFSAWSKTDKRKMTVRIREDEFGHSQLRVCAGDLSHIYCLFLARLLFELYPYLAEEIEKSIGSETTRHGDIQVVGNRWRKVYWRYQKDSEEMYSDYLFTITPNGFVDEKEIRIPLEALPSFMEWLVFEHALYALDHSLYPVRSISPIIDVESDDPPVETHRRVQKNIEQLLSKE